MFKQMQRSNVRSRQYKCDVDAPLFNSPEPSPRLSLAAILTAPMVQRPLAPA
jgi:hypothetical protein